MSYKNNSNTVYLKKTKQKKPKEKQVNKHNKIIHRCAQIPHNSILFT